MVGADHVIMIQELYLFKILDTNIARVLDDYIYDAKILNTDCHDAGQR